MIRKAIKVYPSYDEWTHLAIIEQDYLTMRGIILLSALVLISSCQNNGIDKGALILELDSIMEVDQRYRGQIEGVQAEFGQDSPEMKALWTTMRDTDQSNLKRIEEIIEEVGGYPGISLVGLKSSEVTFFVLQHAPDSIQAKYLYMVMGAANTGELNRNFGAMYLDRYLMRQGESQIYGTQIRTDFVLDPETGERISKTRVWPIADTTKIDSVRMWNGLGPLEDYLNGFGLSRWE